MSDRVLPAELEVLCDVCGRLDQAGVPYMLTGSFAMNYYAEPRMTRDIDLVAAIGIDDAPRLRRILEPDYYVPADAEASVGSGRVFNVLHMQHLVKIDLIQKKAEPFREAEFERRSRIRIEEREVWIVSREDLILSKLLWSQESGSELQLRDVRNLLASGGDREYMRSWAARLHVEAALDACLNERHQP